MNELRIMMHLHGYRNLEFRKEKIFTSDDQWDEGLPGFSSVTNPYFTKLELNATRLLLILSLQKLGKTTEDPARAFLESMESRVDTQADAEIAGEDGIENKWDKMQTRVQNLLARLERYHELLLKCSDNTGNVAPEGSSAKPMAGKPRLPSIDTDKGKLAASLTSSSSHYMSQQSDVESEPLPASEITPEALKKTLQDRLCVTTKSDQAGHFFELAEEDIRFIVDIAQSLGVPGSHLDYLEDVVLRLLREHTFDHEDDAVNALLGYTWLTASEGVSLGEMEFPEDEETKLEFLSNWRVHGDVWVHHNRPIVRSTPRMNAADEEEISGLGSD
jgi:hypothetical protein